MVKLFATEMAVRVTGEAIQVHGGNGYTTERAGRALLARRAAHDDLRRHVGDPARDHLRPAARPGALMTQGAYFEDFDRRRQLPPRARHDGRRSREPTAHEARDEHGARALQRARDEGHAVRTAPRLRARHRLDRHRPGDAGHGGERDRRAGARQDALHRAGLPRRHAVRVHRGAREATTRDREDAGIVRFKHWGVKQDGTRRVRGRTHRADQAASTPHRGRPHVGHTSANVRHAVTAPAPCGHPHPRPDAGARRAVLHDAPRRPRRRRHQGRAAARRHDARHAAVRRRTARPATTAATSPASTATSAASSLDLARTTAATSSCASSRPPTPSSRTRRPASWTASASATRRCASATRASSTRAIRGFGDPRTGASPYADWPAFDIVAQSMGGVVGTTGPGRHRRATRRAPASATSSPARSPRSASSRPCTHARAHRRGTVHRRRHVRRRPQPLREHRLPLLVRRPRARAEGHAATRRSARSTSSRRPTAPSPSPRRRRTTGTSSAALIGPRRPHRRPDDARQHRARRTTATMVIEIDVGVDARAHEGGGRRRARRARAGRPGEHGRGHLRRPARAGARHAGRDRAARRRDRAACRRRALQFTATPARDLPPTRRCSTNTARRSSAKLA